MGVSSEWIFLSGIYRPREFMAAPRSKIMRTSQYARALWGACFFIKVGTERLGAFTSKSRECPLAHSACRVAIIVGQSQRQVWPL